MLASHAVAAEASITLRQGWATVFGGEEIAYHVDVSDPEAMGRTLAWRLAAGNRTVAAGELAPQGGELRLQIPDVKEGAVVDLHLDLGLLSAAEREPIAATRRVIYAFPKNPLADRTRWLEGIRLNVFDPEQHTAEALETLRVPFTRVPRESMIANIQDGTLLIGENVSWEEYRSLVPEMLEAAARGVRVVCLAPAEGKMPLPIAADGAIRVPALIRLRQRDVVVELDKRLDATEWPQGKRVVTRGLRILGEKNQVVAEIVEGGEQWPWLEIGFADTRGRFLVCGFGIMEAWEAGPTPRFLLLRLLEHITQPDQNKENQK